MSASNLVWIDCEMTGLNAYPSSPTEYPDRIIEIAVLITDKDLNILDSEGLSLVIKTEKDVLDRMDDWCQNQHGKTGLIEECLKSETTLEEADDLVVAYISRFFPADARPLLAGSSVHADKMFIRKDLPKLEKMLHYRIVDVSSIKELCSRWYPDVAAQTPRKEESAHRALSDITDSINLLKMYREKVFVSA